MQKVLAVILALVLFAPLCTAQKLLYEGDWAYRTLVPTALTNYEGVHIFGSSIVSLDILGYSTGSHLWNARTSENVSADQGTLEFWIRPNWDGGGFTRYIYVSQYDADNYIYLYKFWSGANLLYLTHKAAGTNRSADTTAVTLRAGEWHHVVGVWDRNNTVYSSDYLSLYVDGVYRDGNTSQPAQMAALSSTAYVGSSGGPTTAGSQIDGVVFGRVLSRALTEYEVEQLYASGAGSLGSVTVNPDTLWYGLFTDEVTDCIYWHRGQEVTATTTTAATVAEDIGSRSWTNNDPIVVSDAIGCSVEGYINGAPAGTTITIDDGAGGNVADLDKTGVHAHIDGSTECYYRTDTDFPESGITGAHDLSIQLWIKPDVIPGFLDVRGLVTKYRSGDDSRMYGLCQDQDELKFNVSSDGTSGNTGTRVSTNANLEIVKWVHIAVTYDASAGSCVFYKNGAVLTDDAGALEVSIADKDPDFVVGAQGEATPIGFFDGSVVNVCLFDDIRTASEILVSATSPKQDCSGEGNIIGQWMFDEAAAATFIDNTQGVAGRDLKPYDGSDTTFGNCGRVQEAFISKNYLPDFGLENGGIGSIDDASIDTTITVSKDTSTIGFDGRSQKVTWASSDDNVELEFRDTTLANGGDYWYQLWAYTPTIDTDSVIYLDVDGAVNIFAREIGYALGDNDEFDRSLGFSGGTIYASGGDINDASTNDICFSCWFRRNGYPTSDHEDIVSKYESGVSEYSVFIQQNTGRLLFWIDDGTSSVLASYDGESVCDGVWHHLVVVFDRSGNATRYVDGLSYGSADGISAVSNSLDNAGDFTVARRNDGTYPMVASLADMKIYIAAGSVWSAAEIEYQCTHPFDYSAGAGTLTDYWQCRDDAATTTITGDANDLTASVNTDTFSAERWKMFEGCFQGDQDGSHKFNIRITGEGAGANDATSYIDRIELRKQLMDNPSLEGAKQGGDPYYPLGWNNAGCEAGEADEETTIVHSGSKSWHINANANEEGISDTGISLIAGRFYTVSVWFRVVGGGAALQIWNPAHTNIWRYSTSKYWKRISVTFEAITTDSNYSILLLALSGAAEFYVDDVSLVEVDKVSASVTTKGSGKYPKSLAQILPLN